MDGIADFVRVLHDLGAPAWTIIFIVVALIGIIFGPKWYKVIREDVRETERIKEEDKRKNETHRLEVRDKLLEQREREQELDQQEQSNRP